MIEETLILKNLGPNSKMISVSIFAALIRVLKSFLKTWFDGSFSIKFKVCYGELYGNYRRCIMSEEEVTTIQLRKSVVKELKNIRRYPRETYNETISNLIKIAKESKNGRQYDEFIHKIQQAKMKELWDNNEDEAWENA